MLESIEKKINATKDKSFFHIGFTMAEVLIALVIVGTISAALIPLIQEIIPNNNRVMFRTAYSSLNKAINNMINDELNYPSSIVGDDVSGDSVHRGFNYTVATTNGTQNKFCYFLAHQFDVVPSTLYCPPANGDAKWGWSAAQSGHFTTTDGINWLIYIRNTDNINNPVTAGNINDTTNANFQFPLAKYSNTNIANASTDYYPIMIFMDVNGTKGPNCLENNWRSVWGAMAAPFPTICPATTTPCSNNPDIFAVDVRYDGKLHVGGYHGYKFTDLCANSILTDPTNNN